MCSSSGRCIKITHCGTFRNIDLDVLLVALTRGPRDAKISKQK
jgi:hypothetical protein